MSRGGRPEAICENVPVRVVPSPAGPEAELARLARPTGPWIHLLDAAPADARQLGWLLGQDGIVVRHLRGHCGRSTYGLLDEVGAALQLPGDPVEDWPGWPRCSPTCPGCPAPATCWW